MHAVSGKKVFDALVRLSISHCSLHCSMCESVWAMCVCVNVPNYSLFIPRCTYTMDHHCVIFVFFGRCTSHPSFLSFSTVFQNYMSTWYVYTHIANNERQQCNNKIQSSSQKSVSHFQIQFGICRFNDFRFNVILYDKDLFPFFSYLWRIRFE